MRTMLNSQMYIVMIADVLKASESEMQTVN